MSECPNCGESTVTTIPTETKFQYGIPPDPMAAVLTVVLPVRHCTSCSFDFLDFESEEIKDNAVIKHLESKK